MQVRLERLAYKDINLLRELRNASSDAFFDDTYITREMQEDWWWRYQLSGKSTMYTIWLNNVTPVGFISAKRTLVETPGRPISVVEIGNLLLASAHRGRGIMHRAMIEVRRLYHDATMLVAHVKTGNEPSLALFARQGFIQLDTSTVKKQRKSVSA